MSDDLETWRTMSGVAAAVVIGTAAATAGTIVALLPVLRRHALAQVVARSSHKVPTPQGGGLAIVLAGLAATAFTIALLPAGRLDTAQLPWVVGASVTLTAVGLIDDLRNLPAVPRLALQALAVAMVVATLPAEARIVDALPVWVERAGLGFALLWFVNLVNFMDGIDWITVAELVPVTAGLAILAALGALPTIGGLVALALLGGLLGFAPFNKPTAKIFLGDVGSLPLGLLVGWLLALVAGRGHLVAALLLPLYYLADATLTLLARARRGERVWEAHRTHFYQRAGGNGLSVPAIVGRVFVTNLVLVALSVTSVVVDRPAVEIATLAAGVIVVAALLHDLARSRATAARTTVS